MKTEMLPPRKRFLIFTATVSLLARLASEGQEPQDLNEGGYVLEEFVVEAESLKDKGRRKNWGDPTAVPPLREPLPVEQPSGSEEPEETTPSFGSPSATALSGEELQRALKVTLGETLAGQPGISASSYSPGVSRPIIRGLDGFRVATLIDGLGTMDLSQESPDHGVSIDTGLADALEIYRGPSALRFGSGAIGGAVNTVTRLRPTLAPEGDWETALSAGYDSQGNGFRGSAGAQLADGLWAVSVFGSHQQAGDISIPGNAWTQEYEELVQPRIFLSDSQERGTVLLPNPRRTLPNSFHESATRSVGLTFGSPDSLQVGVSFAQFTSNYGIPYFFDGDETGLFGQTSIETELNRVDADLSYNPQGRWGPFSKLSLRAASGWYDQSENFDGIGKDEGTNFASVEFERQSTEVRLELFNGEEDSCLTGVSGIHFATNRLDARRFVLQVDGTDDTVLEEQATGFYTTQRLAWQELSLELGIRGESGEVSSDTGNVIAEQVDSLSQSLSLGWETKRIPFLTSFGIHYTASLSERAPSAVERYAFWSNEALGNFIIGGDIAAFIFRDVDGALENEEARHEEISITADWGWGSGILTGYDTQFDNFIFLESRAGLGFQSTAVYVGREARIRGLEGLAEFPLWENQSGERRLELAVSGDWIVGQDETRDQELPRMPAPRAGTTLSYQSPAWGLYLDLRRSFGSGTTPQTPIPEFATDSYTLVNAGVSWRPSWSDDTLQLSLRGTNLLNSEIREHTSFRKDTSPQPGIGVSLDARWNF